MASPEQVRQYLAYWFQLGKRVLVHGGREALIANPVIQGDRYSSEFEAIWQRVTAPSTGDCNLEGTNETVAELLSPGWVLSSCARCGMPVPMIELGLPPVSCPCSDLNNWPDTELPQPRSPVSTSDRLQQIHDRLNQVNPPS